MRKVDGGSYNEVCRVANLFVTVHKIQTSEHIKTSNVEFWIELLEENIMYMNMYNMKHQGFDGMERNDL